MPERPWQSVSADFFGPTSGGWYWFGSISATTPTGRP
jgi:hypothetical protein